VSRRFLKPVVTSQADFHAASPSEWQLACQREAVIRPLADTDMPGRANDDIDQNNEVNNVVAIRFKLCSLWRQNEGWLNELSVHELSPLRHPPASVQIRRSQGVGRGGLS
jgi:hypothetical protein